jgi:hypothetical protein
MTTNDELTWQANSLAKHAGLNTPKDVGCAVIFINRQTGHFCMRAVKTSKEQIRDILKKLNEGYGVQEITEGVDRV